MANETVRIERMTLSALGLNQEEAHRLGEDLGHRLAEQLPEGLRERQLDEIGIRVSVPEGTNRDQTIRLLAEAILEKLV